MSLKFDPAPTQSTSPEISIFSSVRKEDWGFVINWITQNLFDINTQDANHPKFWTLLDYAQNQNNFEVINYLLIQRHAKTADQLALLTIEQKKLMTVVQLYIYEPLSAALKGNWNYLTQLINTGYANLNYEYDNETILDIAIRENVGNDYISLLRTAGAITYQELHTPSQSLSQLDQNFNQTETYQNDFSDPLFQQQVLVNQYQMQQQQQQQQQAPSFKVTPIQQIPPYKGNGKQKLGSKK